MRGKSKKRKSRNAAQDRLLKAVRALPCAVCQGSSEAHHCVGETARHNKIPIGHEFLNALCKEDHTALHNGETFGFGSRKEFEKHAFMLAMGQIPPELRPQDYIIDTILDYHL